MKADTEDAKPDVKKKSETDGQRAKCTTTLPDGTEEQQMQEVPDEEFERKEAGRTSELTLRKDGQNQISLCSNRI